MKTFIITVYTLHSQVLEFATRVEYLEVDLFSGLTWNTHTNRITGTANKTLNFIQRK